MPWSQRRSTSSVVQARKTRSTGASNVRSIRNTRGRCSVTSAPPDIRDAEAPGRLAHGGGPTAQPLDDLAADRMGQRAERIVKAPFGRNEDAQEPGAWWHRHDEYAAEEGAPQ
jgi:hypothetical protein